MEWWVFALFAVAGGANYLWGYSVGRKHGRDWGAWR